MRVHPALFVVLLLAVVVGGATKLGVGPLAKDEPASPWAGAPTGPLETKYGKKQGTFVRLGIEALAQFETGSGADGIDIGTLRNVCAQIAGAEALPVAVTIECRASAAFAEAAAQLPKACKASDLDLCANAARNWANTTDALIVAKRSRADAVRNDLPASRCRTALLPPSSDLRIYRSWAARASALAAAGERGDRAATKRESRALARSIDAVKWQPTARERRQAIETNCPSAAPLGR